MGNEVATNEVPQQRETQLNGFSKSVQRVFRGILEDLSVPTSDRPPKKTEVVYGQIRGILQSLSDNATGQLPNSILAANLREEAAGRGNNAVAAELRLLAEVAMALARNPRTKA